MKQLPLELDKLLDECACGKEPFFLPDYSKFDQKANELLRPFMDYGDDIFHSTEEHSDLSLDIPTAAMAVFSAKKAYYDAQIRVMDGKLDDEKEIRIAVDIFMRFKLLFHFFGYDETSYPGNMAQLYDLDYQFENEKNPQRRQEILKSKNQILESSSSGLYFRAFDAFEEGKLEDALNLCEQAILKFPRNTPVYGFKRNVLLAMAAKTIEEGLKHEPRDQELTVAYDIETQMLQLRRQFAKGTIDAEALVTKLEQIVEENISKANFKLSRYELKVRESVHLPATIQQKSITLLSTGEFLLEILREPLDFAPSAIEFCKALENELRRHLFERFRACYLKIGQTTPSVNEKDHDYRLSKFIRGEEEVTLGSMAMILQWLGSEKEIQKYRLFHELKEFISSFPNPIRIINGDSVRTMLTPEAVSKFRNSSAHIELFTLEKAKDARSWCYRLLNALVEGTKDTSSV